MAQLTTHIVVQVLTVRIKVKAHDDEICTEPIYRVAKCVVYVILPDIQCVSVLCIWNSTTSVKS